MPGAVDLLTSYDRSRHPLGHRDLDTPAWRWPGSGAARLPRPPVLVTADDVAQGKPDPACYLLGAELLGVDARHCLVVEDAAAGVRVGQAAGMTVARVRGVASADLDLASLRDLADGRGPLRTGRPVDA